ncbi:MAG: NUDIX hydrolase, partial [Fibrobacter sp.]|nr:NUDIX hydrolase [Fibrobacter sp.]
MLEIPAGKLDSVGEDRLLAARRELEEETGLRANDWLHLTDTFTTPGFSNEKISLYLARDLQFGQSRPDEDEFL